MDTYVRLSINVLESLEMVVNVHVVMVMGGDGPEREGVR